MAIYSSSGTELVTVYNSAGVQLPRAYNASGEEVFPANPYLRVMTYNVQRWLWGNAVKATQDEAFANNADIVGIQEWGYSSSLTIEGQNCVDYIASKGYPNISITSLDVNHKAVASKYPMSDYTETVFSVSRETRSYTKAYFVYKGVRIAFFNAHLDYAKNDTYKFQQAAELLAAVENEDFFILTGDFNTTCSDKSETEYQSIVQPFVDAGYNVANSPDGEDLIMTYFEGNTVEEATSIRPTDNIITSPNIRFVNLFVDDYKLHHDSGYVIDHIPLIADLELTENEVT